MRSPMFPVGAGSWHGNSHISPSKGHRLVDVMKKSTSRTVFTIRRIDLMSIVWSISIELVFSVRSGEGPLYPCPILGLGNSYGERQLPPDRPTWYLGFVGEGGPRI